MTENLFQELSELESEALNHLLSTVSVIDKIVTLRNAAKMSVSRQSSLTREIKEIMKVVRTAQ